MADVPGLSAITRVDDRYLAERQIERPGDEATAPLTVRVQFAAQKIRQERYRTHAVIGISVNEVGRYVEVAYGDITLERDEDRVRLSNSAHKALNGLADCYPVTYLKKDLDVFCRGLWAAHVGSEPAEMMEGLPEPRPTRFSLEPYILEEGGSILFAAPKRGKSWLLMLMAVSLDGGVSAIWPVPRARRVLFINLERPRESLRNRLSSVNRALGLPPRRPLFTLNRRGRSLADVYDYAKLAIKQHQVEVVLLDSITRAGLGDLTENKVANECMDLLNALCPTWMAIAHAPRASTPEEEQRAHVFGSQMFDAAADVLVRVTAEPHPEEGTLGVGLTIASANDLPHYPAQVLELTLGPAGLDAIRAPQLGEYLVAEGRAPESARQRIIDHLLVHGASSVSALAAELGLSRTTINTTLHGDTHTFVFVRQDGRQRLYAVRAHV